MEVGTYDLSNGRQENSKEDVAKLEICVIQKRRVQSQTGPTCTLWYSLYGTPLSTVLIVYYLLKEKL